MSGISKRVSGSWVSGDYGIMKTATDTITTLPADLYADGNNATVGLVGNMSQSGTPTPTNPIQPQECGDLETEGTKAGQYKIPILSANAPTQIYLGEVETTRKIKKLVLDGTENWYIEGSDIFYTDRITEAVRYTPICSHFIGVNALTGNNQVTISQTLRINIKATTITHTASDFKTYLQQQYAAGTPVTVWYVLATPTTGIVNEPIRKIGEYADTVNGISIPTTAGGDTISVDTTLQPSEVTVNYKGWHPVADVHEKSANMFDWSQLVDGYHLSQQTGLPESNPKRTGLTQSIDVSSITRLYLSYTKIDNDNIKAMYSVLKSDDTLARRVTNIGSGDLLDTSGGVKLYIAFYDGASASTTVTKDNVGDIMLNTGSSALPYEPYWT